MGLEPALAAMSGMICLDDSEDRLQAAEELVLRTGIGCGDEYGVVTRNRARHLRPLGLVDGNGDALSGTYSGLQYRERGTGSLQAAHELREHPEITIGARDLLGRQNVAPACFQHAQIPKVAAHRRLRDLVALFLQQAHEILLLADKALPQ